MVYIITYITQMNRQFFSRRQDFCSCPWLPLPSADCADADYAVE